MIRTMWIRTQDLHKNGGPLSKQDIINEVKAQGLESLVFHLMWSHYLVFSYQTNDGIVTEIKKSPHGYIYRTIGLNWILLKPDHIRSIIREDIKCVI